MSSVRKVLDSTVMYQLLLDYYLTMHPYMVYIPVGKIVPSSSKNSGSPSTMNTVTVLPP